MSHHRRTVMDPRPRPITQNPRYPLCERHLSRTCGTCAHWDGPLRGRGECRLFAGPVDGVTSALRCEDWTRKWAPGRVEGAT